MWVFRHLRDVHDSLVGDEEDFDGIPDDLMVDVDIAGVGVLALFKLSQVLSTLGRLEVVVSHHSVRAEEPWRPNSADGLRDLGHTFHRVEGAGGEVDNATGGSGHKSDHSLPDPFEEAADAIFDSALVGLETDPCDALEDAHDDAFAAACQALAKVLPAALLDSFATFPLEVFVKSQRSKYFADSSGDFRDGARCTTHNTAEHGSK